MTEPRLPRTEGYGIAYLASAEGDTVVVVEELGARGVVLDLDAAATTQPRLWRALRVNPSFWIGLIGVSLIITAAVFAPILTAHDPIYQYRGTEGHTVHGDPLGPTPVFPLGTDLLGRDYLSRLLYGARASLTVGIGANLLATVIGVTIGAVAGFAGTPIVRVPLGRGREIPLAIPVESVLMRFTDVVLSFPALLLAIALVAVLRPSLGLVILVIATVLWTGLARIVYGRVLSIRDSEFVIAARAVGVGPVRILRRHIGPHLISIVVVYATLGIAGTVLFEATLSFLGVGVPPPAPSWGGMISENLGYYKTDPRLVLFPGLAMMSTILSFNLLGDALADALDPHHWR